MIIDYGNQKSLGVHLMKSGPNGMEEVSGPNYHAQICIDWDVTQTPNGIKVQNREEIEFPEAKTNWGKLVAFKIVNTDGQQYIIDLDKPKEVGSGGTVKVPAGDLEAELQ